MFRLSLDTLGPVYQKARLVMCLGALEKVSLPDKWKPYFTNIEIAWADVESYKYYGDGGDHVYNLLSLDADISIICDADTLILRPFPDEFFLDMMSNPAIYGVIAHYPPPYR